MILGRRERAFLLGSLFHRHLDLEAIRRETGEGFDWSALGAAAAPAGLGPSAWNAAREAGIVERIPAELRERLAAAYDRNTASNAATLALLRRAQRVLAERGVEALPLKGAAVMLHEPGLVPLRHMDDLDLLVRPRQVQAAKQALEAAGWVVVGEPVSFGGVPVAEDEHARIHHGVALRGPTDLLLELHHALPSQPGLPRLADEGLFSRAVERPHGGGTVRCPSAEDLAAICCEHALVHHRAQLMPLPRLVADLQALVDAGLDLTRARPHWDPAVAQVVEEGFELLEETREAARHPGSLGRGQVERVLSPLWRRANLAWFTLRAWVGAPRIFAEALARHGWRAIIPTRAYMAARYGVSPSSPVLPLLYAWRPLRGAVRLVFRR